MRNLLYALLTISAIVACSPVGNDSCITIDRLDRAIAEYPTTSSAQRAALTDSFADDIKALQFIYSDTTPVWEFLTKLGISKGYRVFQPDIEKSLPDLDSIEHALGSIKANLAEKLPDVRFPHCVAIVSPFRQSVFNVDTTMLIGLNHYLGENHPAYAGFEPYLKATKNARHLPYDALLSILSAAHPYEQTATSNVLSRLLYEGACLYCMEQTIDGWSKREALGWNERQLEWAKKNEAQAWNALVERDLLFSTDPSVAQRLVEPSPSTAILHRESPGQLGRYIGLKIVESYMKANPDTALKSLLSPDFYESPTTLSKAKYSP